MENLSINMSILLQIYYGRVKKHYIDCITKHPEVAMKKINGNRLADGPAGDNAIGNRSLDPAAEANPVLVSYNGKKLSQRPLAPGMPSCGQAAMCPDHD
jgi:hypothetical protein